MPWARSKFATRDSNGLYPVPYAIGTIAAAVFGAILYTVVTGDSVMSALSHIINCAFNSNIYVMVLSLTINDESADTEYHYGKDQQPSGEELQMFWNNC